MSSPDGLVAATPIAVLDFETTGFSPKTGARVIEVAVVRIEPGGDPSLVLDTLIDPDGPVHATRIHGITDDDVLGAPLFSDVAAELAISLSSAVIAAFNAAFDVRFLDAEYHRFPNGRSEWTPPHVCLMYLRPLLGLGPKCSLAEACAIHGLPPTTHRAADDALAAAHLWLHYLEAAESRGVKTFGDMERSGYKFAESLRNPTFHSGLVAELQSRSPRPALKPRLEPIAFQFQRQRSAIPPDAYPVADRRRRYWKALVDALSDATITAEEMETLRTEQRAVALANEDLRAIHGKLAGEVLAAMSGDAAITSAEAEWIARLFEALRSLGWAPGDNG